jgi:hypothetical protein
MKGDLLNRLYERNPNTGNYIIEIALDKYLDVFNDWDHASYRKRDMDPELAYFLEDCSDEVPLPHGLDLVFYLPRRARDVGKESIISGVVKGYYQFYANFERRKLRRADRRRLNYVVVATILLAVTSLSNLWRYNVVLSTVGQGLTVGGWVFLWEAISFFFLTRSENMDKIKNYQRLANANIYFRYDP